MPRILLSLLLLLTLQANAADRAAPQSITLPTGPLAFTAAVETIRLANAKNEPQAEIVTTAFLRGTDAAHPDPNRPVTFALNGGPGAASAFLDIGAIGPWRVPIAVPIVPGQNPTAVDNAETWLPFTDLVFIDPVGTGYSRITATAADDRRPFLTLDGDIRSLATVIRRWLEAHNRLTAPKFIVGESYGGFRAPRLARALLQQQGVGISGLVLVSPVLDFNGFLAGTNPLNWVTHLPGIAATQRHATSRTDLADVEAYAAGEYIADLLRGPRDATTQARLEANVIRLTGLDPALVHRRAGRIDTFTALRDRDPGRAGSPYDATITAPEPNPEAQYAPGPDPVLDGLRAPLTSGMLALYRRLDWQPDGAPAREYEILNNALNHDWDYGRSNDRPESLTALRQVLAIDPTSRVLVTHGLTDLVTPYFADVLALNQIPETVPPGRLALHVYPGGHMSYLLDASRIALRDDAATLIAAVLAARTEAQDTPPPAPSPPPAPAAPTPPATR